MNRVCFRWRKRGWLVFNNGLNLVGVPALNVIVSVLVVRLASADLWGALIGWFLLVQLGAHIVAWGNKDYLVRRFSQNPARIAVAWQTSCLTRVILLLPIGIWLAFESKSLTLALWLIAWCALTAFDQSFEAPVVYYKQFGWAAAVDLGGVLALAIVVLVIGAGLTLNLLIALFVMVALAKTIALGLHFRRALLPQRRVGNFDWRDLRASFPLFLLTLSGLLASRVDAYAVNALLPREDVAQYQVYLNFLLMLQTGAAVLLLPFVKNLYRLGAHAFLKQSVWLAGIGFFVTILGVAVIGLVVPLLYHWTLTPAQLALGVVIVLPTFFYAPIVFALYQQKREMWVVIFSFMGAALSLALAVWLLPRLGLVGGLVGNASGQVTILVAYWLASRRIGRTALATRVEPVS